jgi:hypothetical protein
VRSNSKNIQRKNNMREWKKFTNDELWTIWKGYQKTEFPSYGDPLHQHMLIDKPIRITCIEMIRLVDELMDRLEIKENSNK